MPNRNQIIIISVLSLIALLIGYFKNPLNLSMGERAEAEGPVPPTIVTNVITNLANNIVTNTVPVKPKPNPVKPKPPTPKEATLEEKTLVGTYEHKVGANAFGWSLRGGGEAKNYFNREKGTVISEWRIVNKEIHIISADSNVGVYIINPDNSLTAIATIRDGKRKIRQKKQQYTYKKIK